MIPWIAAAAPDVAPIFIELGTAIVGLAVLARLANRFGFSAIPLYMLAGVAFGDGGLLPLHVSEEFIRVGAEIGVVLLLFTLGLEYSGEELAASLRGGLPAGLADFALNFTPGFAAGLLLGWGPIAATVLGGVTWISSSGVIAKVLAELGRMDSAETPVVLSVLVIEDLAMAVYLPLISVLLVGRGLAAGLVSIAVALTAVGVLLLVALRYGKVVSRVVENQPDEIILLTTFGLVLLVAGAAQRLQVSAAVGAFLVGIALTGSIAHRVNRLLSPLRDLFAATFFFFFGLEIDPASLVPVLPAAVTLGAVTSLSKLLTGWWAAGRDGLDRAARWRAGATLVARGEFSVVIAGLGVAAGLEPRLGPLSAAYVLLLAILGPALARAIPSPKPAVSAHRG